MTSVFKKLNTIPTGDVRSRVRRRFIKETIICVAVDAVLIALTIATRSFSPAHITLVVILCLAPYIHYHYLNWFTDCTYEGEIIEAKLSEHAEKKYATSRNYGFVNVFRHKLKILEPDGRIRRVELNHSEDAKKTNYVITFYVKGNYVRHYYGTKYLQKIGEKMPSICVFCGTQNMPGGKCGVCGAGLIDNTK